MFYRACYLFTELLIFQPVERNPAESISQLGTMFWFKMLSDISLTPS